MCVYVCMVFICLRISFCVTICEERPVVVRALRECYHCQRRPGLKSLNVGGQSLGLDLAFDFTFAFAFGFILFILFLGLGLEFVYRLVEAVFLGFEASFHFISVTGFDLVRFGSISWFPIWTLEIPTTNVSAEPGGRREESSNVSRSLEPKIQQTSTSGSGGVSESPRGVYGEVCGWSNTITREPMDGRVLG